MRQWRAILLGAIALFAVPKGAPAADILEAWYDRARDEIVARIAYRGTTPDHPFRLAWGRCFREGEAPYGIAARVIDQRGGEAARSDFVAQERFPLAGLDCRPARVTIRLGKVSHATVFVPEPGVPAAAR